jgi:hypothetical protein
LYQFECVSGGEANDRLLQRAKRLIINKRAIILKKSDTMPRIIRHKPSSENKTMTEKSYDQEAIVSRIGVSNVVDVSEDFVDNTKLYESYHFDRFLASPNSCFFTPIFIIYNLILFAFVMSAILIAISFGLKARKLQKKLHLFEQYAGLSRTVSRKNLPHPYYDAHSFAYGRMVDLTQAK